MTYDIENTGPVLDKHNNVAGSNRFLLVITKVYVFNENLFFSVHLARRVLQLEKINSNLKKDVDTEKIKIKQLAEEVCYVKFKRNAQKVI